MKVVVILINVISVKSTTADEVSLDWVYEDNKFGENYHVSQGGRIIEYTGCNSTWIQLSTPLKRTRMYFWMITHIYVTKDV